MLDELKLTYRVKVSDPVAAKARGIDTLAVALLGKVPVLIEDEGPDGRAITVADRLAIALYLTEKTGRFLPTTPRARTMAWTWGCLFGGAFEAAFDVIAHGRRLGAANHGALIDKAFADLEYQFGALDAHLERHRYIAGDRYSWVDPLAIPLMGSAERLGIDLTRRRHLSQWSDVVLARPAVRRGMSNGLETA